MKRVGPPLKESPRSRRATGELDCDVPISVRANLNSNHPIVKRLLASGCSRLGEKGDEP